MTSSQFALSNLWYRDRRKDGLAYRWLSERICSLDEGKSLSDGVWKTILQAADSEIGIRHLLLIVGHLHSSQSPSSFLSIIAQHQHLARHHLNHLISISEPANRLIYETAFIALYLLTYIQILSKRVQQARKYQRIAFLVLRKALRVFDRGYGEEGDGLPGCMKDVVVAFGRL